MWVDANRSCYRHELGRIESPFAEFELRHERLPLANAFAELGLGDASVLASLHKQLNHSLVEIGSK